MATGAPPPVQAQHKWPLQFDIAPVSTIQQRFHSCTIYIQKLRTQGRIESLVRSLQSISPKSAGPEEAMEGTSRLSTVGAEESNPAPPEAESSGMTQMTQMALRGWNGKCHLATFRVTHWKVLIYIQLLKLTCCTCLVEAQNNEKLVHLFSYLSTTRWSGDTKESLTLRRGSYSLPTVSIRSHVASSQASPSWQGNWLITIGWSNLMKQVNCLALSQGRTSWLT